MKPLVSGHEEFLVDADGVEYIDAISGVYNASYGHGHPRIMRVLQFWKTVGLLNCYDNPTPQRFALEEELCGLTSFTEVHLFSSGAETVEKALLLALRSTQDRSVLHFSSGFHGKTMGTYGLFYGHGSGHKGVSSPLCARMVNSQHDEDTLLRDIKSNLAIHRPRHEATGCGVVIIEPVMGYFGRVFSISFLRKLRDLCTERGAILIFDEMITSFGRTGVNFVSDLVKPDILVVGKGLGQGLPIMAVLFDLEGPINAEGFSWTTATANNPLLCRVGLESCKILVEEKMAESSRWVGYILEKMLSDSHTVQAMCEVRRAGSMVFVEVKGEDDVKWLEDQMRDTHHILTRAHANVLVLMPPFVISGDSLKKIVCSLDCLFLSRVFR